MDYQLESDKWLLLVSCWPIARGTSAFVSFANDEDGDSGGGHDNNNDDEHDKDHYNCYLSDNLVQILTVQNGFS